MCGVWETHCSVASRVHHSWGVGRPPRHVPWWNEPAAFYFVGQCPTNCATLARALLYFFSSAFVRSVRVKWQKVIYVSEKNYFGKQWHKWKWLYFYNQHHHPSYQWNVWDCISLSTVIFLLLMFLNLCLSWQWFQSYFFPVICYINSLLPFLSLVFDEVDPEIKSIKSI